MLIQVLEEKKSKGSLLWLSHLLNVKIVASFFLLVFAFLIFS